MTSGSNYATLPLYAFGQSFKSATRPNLNRRARTMRDEDHNNVVPSTPQSECSTLVDFVIDHVELEATAELEDDDDQMMEPEDRAWGPAPSIQSSRLSDTKKPKSKSASKSVASFFSRRLRRTPVPVPRDDIRPFQAQLLDPLDRAWM